MSAPPNPQPAMQTRAQTTASINPKAALPGAVRRALGSAAALALPLALVLLQGCASAPPPVVAKPVEKTDGTPKMTVAPALQAEMDAALALAKAEQYEQSIEAFKKLIAALPDNPIPLTNLALIYKKLDKPELAEQHLKQALEIEPTNPVAGNELALLYRKSGRFAEARPVYERLLVKYPNFSMVHKNLGVLCDLYLRDYECALSHYQSYALNAPGDKNVQIWIADLRKRTGK